LPKQLILVQQIKKIMNLSLPWVLVHQSMLFTMVSLKKLLPQPKLATRIITNIFKRRKQLLQFLLIIFIYSLRLAKKIKMNIVLPVSIQ